MNAARRPSIGPLLVVWTNYRPAFLAIIGALFVGAAVVVTTGHDPVATFGSMIASAFRPDNIPVTIARAVPIIGMGMAVAIPLRAGHINLGGEGQIVLGALVAAIIGIFSPLPAPVTIVIAMLGAAGVAGAYALIATEMYLRLMIPTVIGTLLLSYPARSLGSFIARYPLRAEGSGLPQTALIPEDVRLPELISESPLGTGVLIVLAIVLTMTFIDRRTPAGLEIRMTGLNPRFSGYVGIDLRRMVRRVMFLGGACAGVAGGIAVLGSQYRFIDGSLITPGYTFTGLLVALLGNGSPIGVLLGGLFFAALQVGGEGMERTTQVPRELTEVVQAVMIFFLAAASTVAVARTRSRSGRSRTPATPPVEVE